MKKTIGVMLAFVMMLSMGSVAFAKTDKDKGTKGTVSHKAKKHKKGQTTPVTTPAAANHTS
jgi:hypothetical protein